MSRMDSDYARWQVERRQAWQEGVHLQHEAQTRESHEMAKRGETRAIDADSRSRLHQEEQRAYQARQEQRQEQQSREQQDYQVRQERRSDESQEMARRGEARSIEAHAWGRESHSIHMQRERERQESERRARQLAHARFGDPTPSGVLGNARFATLDDCREMGLCDSSGLFLGLMFDRQKERPAGLYYNGDRHVTTYAGTRSGKGVNLILTNLALYGRSKPRSLIVVDVKDGENAFATAHHRARNIKQRVLCLNPANLHGIPGITINPFDPVIDAPLAEKFDRAHGPASVLAPVTHEHQNAWINEGAALILQATIAHLAATDPIHCSPGQLWEFFINGNHKALEQRFGNFKTSPLAAVRGYALSFLDWMRSPNQWNAYSSAIAKALQGFAPESPYTQATDTSSGFRAREVTQDPTTVYLMMRSDDLLDKGHWVSLMLNYFVRETAAHPGPCDVLFLLDEFTQLPPVPRILEAVNKNAGRGQRFWFFAQDRETLEKHYGKSGAGQFERQSGIVQTWDTMDVSLLRDWEYLGGKTSVQVMSASMSDGGQFGTGLNLTEQVRPLLQPEDIRLVPEGTQYMLPHHGPMIRAKLCPWYRIETVKEVVQSTRLMPLNARLEPLYPALPHFNVSTGIIGAGAKRKTKK